MSLSQTDRFPNIPEQSDLNLARRVSLFLAHHQRPALRKLQVEARDGIVTIRGQVATYFEKQLAHQFARHVAGVRQVIDEVSVSPPRPIVRHWSADPDWHAIRKSGEGVAV